MNRQILRKKSAPEEPEGPVPGRIVGGKVRFISLCPMGKNRIQASYKAEGSETEEQFELALAVKAQPNFEEEGLLTGIVYAPGVLDDDGNWAEASAIKAIAYDFMINGEGIDIWHDGVALGPDRAALVESFIVQKADPRFEGLPIDPVGGWGVVIQLNDEELRAKHRGESGWRGLSLGGTIVVEPNVMPAEKALTTQDFLRTMRRIVRESLRPKDDMSTSIRSIDLRVELPRAGETDWEGNLRRPSFYINLSGDI